MECRSGENILVAVVCGCHVVILYACLFSVSLAISNAVIFSILPFVFEEPLICSITVAYGVMLQSGEGRELAGD